MKILARIAGALAALSACLMVPAAFAQGTSTLVPAQKVPPARPALWVVSDADTTIYLFGTVHALPPGINWYNGAVLEAFEGSEELVTEIVESDPAQMQSVVMKTAFLPKNQTLRAMLSPAERKAFDAALARLGVPPASMDTVEPWFAAITLSTMPLMRAGYTGENGVEGVLNARAGALGQKHSGLETPEFQLGVFDKLPVAVQKMYLMDVVDKLPTITDELRKMVDAWKSGDAEGLAALITAGEDDPAMLEALLYGRNRTWADWIKARLDSPGKVFIAVGAGHLAGAGSVQENLAARGIASIRVQ